MLLALQRYDLDVIYKPGEQQVIADTLSRLPAEQPQAEELSPQEIFQIASMQEEAQELEGIEEREFVRVKDQRLEEVKKAAATDPEQLALSQMIGRGWPSSIREVPSLARKYWTFREALVMQDGVIYKGGQVVVPELLRANYLRRLHSSHQSTLRRARDTVYWPNMADDISNALSVSRTARHRQSRASWFMRYLRSRGARWEWICSVAGEKITWLLSTT